MIDFHDKTARIGALASALWLVLAALSLILGGDGAERGLLQRLVSLMGIVAPFALIWLAVWFGQGVRSLQDETHMLREQLAGLDPAARTEEDVPSMGPVRAAFSAPAPPQRVRPSASHPQPPHPQSPRPQPPHSRPAVRAEAHSPVSDAAPPPPEPEPWELVAALNFPDGPDDHHAIAALRLALANPELARLIRAAQDVVTLMAGRGIYMEDLIVPEAGVSLWRDFAAGRRGEEVAALALEQAETARDTTRAMMQDVVFHDVAHHFMRQFDRILSRMARYGDDEILIALSWTRSGRAFTLLAQTMGMLGAADGPAQEGASPREDA